MPSARPLALAALAAALATPLAGQDRVREVLFDHEFDVGAGGRLLTEVGDMDLDIRPGEVTSVRVRVIGEARTAAYARDEFERQRFEATASGAEVRIRTREERRDWSLDEWRQRGGVWLRAEITVPRAFDLALHTGDGDVRVGEITGDVSIDTGDGDVWIEGVVGSRVSLHTGDGDMSVRRLEAGDIELRTGDGDLVLERLSGRIDASTGDGDVSLDIERFAGATIRTGDGDVTITADASLAAEVDIAGADLELLRPFEIRGRLGRRHVTGTLNGGGPRLSVRTGDGSVTLRAR